MTDGLRSPDDLDRLLRSSLQHEAGLLEPSRTGPEARSQLARRITLRRQRRGASLAGLALVAVASLTIVRLDTGGRQVITSSGPLQSSASAYPTTSAPTCGAGCSGTTSVPPTTVPASPTTPAGGDPGTTPTTGLPPGTTVPLGPDTTLPPSTTTTFAVPSTTEPAVTTTTYPVIMVGSTTTTTVVTPTSRTVVFTQADSGQSVSVPSNDIVEVRLDSCAGRGWTTPRSNRASVLKPQPAPPTTAPGQTTADFLARGQGGTASISSSARATACPAAAFSLTVTVVQ